ncbi:hypothetical protein C1925_12190 [Stenotrophomonas sp. SAU14A_NAIMI4_5]|nr:hypothetical protein C1925_12190 [Stenotrophomonas sp. SAU14A_NAIMI4_5]
MRSRRPPSRRPHRKRRRPVTPRLRMMRLRLCLCLRVHVPPQPCRRHNTPCHRMRPISQGSRNC